MSLPRFFFEDLAWLPIGIFRREPSLNKIHAWLCKPDTNWYWLREKVNKKGILICKRMKNHCWHTLPQHAVYLEILIKGRHLIPTYPLTNTHTHTHTHTENQINKLELYTWPLLHVIGDTSLNGTYSSHNYQIGSLMSLDSTIDLVQTSYKSAFLVSIHPCTR